jgi:hypothetical protein
MVQVELAEAQEHLAQVVLQELAVQMVVQVHRVLQEHLAQVVHQELAVAQVHLAQVELVVVQERQVLMVIVFLIII